MNQRPLGLVVLGVMAGLGGMLMALLLLAVDEKADASIVLVRAAAAALAAAALIAAEALVRVRPWFYRAALGLAVTWCVVVTCGTIVVLGLEGIAAAMGIIGASLVILLPAMVYIRDEWEKMRRAPARVPAPPRPWPVPGRVP